MVRVFHIAYLNTLLFSCVLVSFSLATVTPRCCYAEFNFGIDEAFFTLKMKNLAEKIQKYKKKSNLSKLLDTVLEVKNEIEYYTGQFFDLDYEISKAENTLKENNQKYSKKDMSLFKKIIKKKDKQLQTRNACMASYLQNSPCEITFEDFELLDTYAIQKDNRPNKDEKDVMSLPERFGIGMSMVLGGGFMVGIGWFLKIPTLVLYGDGLVISGIGFLCDGYLENEEEKKKRENNLTDHN